MNRVRILLLVLAASSVGFAQTPCVQLQSLKLPDTGHEGGNARFAVGHPEKIVDFSYRAVHEMVVKSKAVITAFYGRGPRLSYWNGCSTGGRQGLMEAQRYPEDFDGIVAGAPAN